MTQWLSVEEIAKELNVPLDTVRAWIRSKRLKAYKPGKEYRVKREDLDRFLEESSNRDDGSTERD